MILRAEEGASSTRSST